VLVGVDAVSAESQPTRETSTATSPAGTAQGQRVEVGVEAVPLSLVSAESQATSTRAREILTQGWRALIEVATRTDFGAVRRMLNLERIAIASFVAAVVQPRGALGSAESPAIGSATRIEAKGCAVHLAALHGLLARADCVPCQERIVSAPLVSDDVERRATMAVQPEPMMLAFLGTVFENLAANASSAPAQCR